MKLEVQYWDRISPLTIASEPKGERSFIEGETEDEIFEEFYRRNNRLRYCNGSYWRFPNYDDDVRYNFWRQNLSKDRAFNLYYGDGLVD